MDDELVEGLYDAVITSRLEARMRRTILQATRKDIDKADRPEVLARHVADVLRRVLPDKNPGEQLEVVNQVIDDLGQHRDRIAAAERLVSLTRPSEFGRGPTYNSYPSTPLAEATLLTNMPGEPSVGTELRAELGSADEVDLLCAFIKWHGLRTLERQLISIADRGVPLRVITTTYMGATERRAIDRLVREFNAEVRISYEVQRTRLHAKAWLFRRNSGFDTAYVGSSNLSRAALLDGVEWNVRLTAVVTAALLRKFRATFDIYWNDPSYERYDPDRDADRLDHALGEAGGILRRDRATITLSGLEVHPYPHQQEALEALDAERAKGHHHNLVVAATGTGKTVIAALDYCRLCEESGRRLSLLFVAHRKEILQQALRTYREVLNDPTFGDLYVGGNRPNQLRHLFASIQTLNVRDIRQIEPDAFDIVVIDEFHHAAAESYDELLTHLDPVELLGLTATPERADGKDVRSYFDQRTAVELRLWDALSADLLCPFHYFGIGDGTDLRATTWTRGSYDVGALSNLYTSNDARSRLILKEVRDKIVDPATMRGLGFCVSIEHAQYMSDVFNQAGIPALAISGQSGTAEREEALARLSSCRINMIFAVDLYNEGIDVPEIDTVLFLRPTESATIFLQQLGRGLRRTQDKAVLTVLDFVGHHRKEFRFDRRFSALTGIPRAALPRAVEEGFPYLPSGCQIILDRTSQEAVLANLKAQLRGTWKSVVEQAQETRTSSLAQFLDITRIDLADVLRPRGPSPRSWTRARREAGIPTPPGGPREAYLLRRIANLAHVDDALRAQTYLDLLDDHAPAYEELDPLQQTVARMLVFALWPDGGGFGSYGEGLALLTDERSFRDEVSQVMQLAVEGSRHIPRPLPGGLGLNPLRSHAHYSREELVAALDWATLERTPQVMRQGVFHAPEWNADALMITVKKSERDFSPTTMYRDYAISTDLFHWESQSTTTVDSPTGQRYVQQRERGNQVLLFSRQSADGPFGTAQPYLLLGTGNLVKHEGERPIAFTWRLNRPMPQEHFQMAITH